MKPKKIVPIIGFLLILLIYICSIDAIPTNILLLKNEKLELSTLLRYNC
ncbi:MAG: hypothetical protein LBL91_02330 [Lachnospiraceae bacterium]|nr:hypothetical protein [Lachnospiraceae bacterium]